jgi:hypothetical protein
VTKESRSEFSYLDLLVEFLNFDFGSGDARSIKKYFKTKFVQATFPPNRQLKRLQTTVKREVLSVVAPTDKPDRAEIGARINRIVARVNKIRFKSTWHAEFIPDDDEYVEYEDASEVFVTPPCLHLPQGTWFVSQLAGLTHKGPLEHFLWWIVINGMHDGRLANLKLCAGCKKLFRRTHTRQEFCSEECRYDFNNRRRQAKGYFRDKRKQTRELLLRKAQTLLRTGRSPAEVSSRTKLSLRLLKQEGLL